MFVLVSSKEVLTSLDGSFAIVDGMARTVVVTGETVGATTLVRELRQQPFATQDVMGRTSLRATTTANTA